MLTPFDRCVVWLHLAVLPLMVGSVSAWEDSADERYQSPSAMIEAALDAEPLPRLTMSPDRNWLVLTHWNLLPRIADLATPSISLARRTIDPRTGAPPLGSSGDATGFTLVRLSDGLSWKLDTPTSGLSSPLWAPDSRHFAFRRATSKGVELWIVDLRTRVTRALTAPILNMARSSDGYPPYAWMPDSRRLLTQMIPQGRRLPPAASAVPTGPVVSETGGVPTQAKIYGSSLRNEHDEALYEYYMTSQAMMIDVLSGEQAPIGVPHVYDSLNPSPDGRYILAVRIVRPYSRLYTDDRFPRITEILDLDSERVRTVDDRPGGHWGFTGAGWTSPGPRRFMWVPGLSSTLVYIESLDGGDPRRNVAYRDRLLTLASPFSGEPTELIRTRGRLPSYHSTYQFFSGAEYSNIAWLSGGTAWVEEIDPTTRRKRIWLVDARKRSQQPRLIFDFNAEDAGEAPGDPLLTRGRGGWNSLTGVEEPVIRQDGPWIYLVGRGASDEGRRPFLDRYNIETGRNERLFQAVGNSYEEALMVLDSKARQILTRYETPDEQPGYFVRDLRAAVRRNVTHVSPQISALSSVRVQFLRYVREDGLTLHGSLYLPSGYRHDHPLPVIIWAYPQEFHDKAAANRFPGSPYRYTQYSGSWMSLIPTTLASQGYAVLWNASMPVLGGIHANDTAVQQLTANAEAAVNKLVDLGIADRQRIGVAGHSYGGLMVATMLAHTDLFATGVALSGIYNLTNAPFGVQYETRTLWEAHDTYLQLSPVIHANKIKSPLLLIHGAEDDNYASTPAEAERMYQALQGLGGEARLVMLPYEAHTPRARESILHVLWEMLSWCDRHLKTPNTVISRNTEE